MKSGLTKPLRAMDSQARKKRRSVLPPITSRSFWR
jgi:hypothetical protein